jgi:hypothetical protein
MSLSLLMALLEPDTSDLASDYKNWTEGHPERRELMLQALYQALNGVLYEQASKDPDARQRNRVLFMQGTKAPRKEQDEARAHPEAGRAIGTLLAREISKHPESHPVAPEDIQELRQKLREELREQLIRLRKEVEPGSYV